MHQRRRLTRVNSESRLRRRSIGPAAVLCAMVHGTVGLGHYELSGLGLDPSFHRGREQPVVDQSTGG